MMKVESVQYKGLQKSHGKGEEDRREAAWWAGASENEAESQWGKEGRDELSHTQPVPTVDPANPCLNWGRIPAHMCPWSEWRAKEGENSGASDTSDRPRGGWAAVQRVSALCWKINMLQDCQHI